SVAHVSAAKKLAEQENVAGMHEVLELASAARRLERVVHWSSATVSGARRGYVLEDELSARYGFHNAVERTQLEAERLLRRAASRIPSVILRPTTLVGDSLTGEIDRFEGPYLLVLLMLSSPGELRLPMPGHGDTPLNLVPIDYVVEAGMHIARHARAVGRTFHIVDPDPLTARRVIELIADATGRPVPRAFVPGQFATTLLKTPGLNQFSHVPRAFLDQVRTEVVYDDRNAKELLAGSGIRCPGFEEYVDVMVRYVRGQQAEIRAKALDELLPDHEPL
ncbi:MAG: SDR family oxidoreductase, partial [Polyangiaceae bacterium]|nr:SDR family oxidoreductase [Polyangiaceae bacterium]